MSKNGQTPSVGILANPAAGRDIRRLVAQASVFPISEKRNMIARLFTALGSLGVGTVYMMVDRMGISDRMRHALQIPPPGGQVWPTVEFLEAQITESAADTLNATRMMADRGVGAIIVLGGDGTHRLVASQCGDIPLAALSTGTNNVFPEMREATIAGIASALVATGQVPLEVATRRNKALRVDVNGVESDLALVDLCASTEIWIGSRALWRAEGLDQLFLAFAEADAVGLSSIGGLVNPISREVEGGLLLNLTEPHNAKTVVAAPLAPGLIVDIGVESVREIRPGEFVPLRIKTGVIALDGEREIEFSIDDDVSIRLEWDGPLTLDIPLTMAYAAEKELLIRMDDETPHARFVNK